MIECDHWTACNVNGGGCCAAGHYGGRPSFGVCKQCPHRVLAGVRAEMAIGETQRFGAASLAAAYAAAELRHATQGPASDADFEARKALCLACDARALELQGKTDARGLGFCTKCGCGAGPRAALSVKLTIAGAACPLKKWGQVDGTGATIGAAAEAAMGFLGTLAHQAKAKLGKNAE